MVAGRTRAVALRKAGDVRHCPTVRSRRSPRGRNAVAVGRGAAWKLERWAMAWGGVSDRDAMVPQVGGRDHRSGGDCVRIREGTASGNANPSWPAGGGRLQYLAVQAAATGRCHGWAHWQPTQPRHRQSTRCRWCPQDRRPGPRACARGAIGAPSVRPLGRRRAMPRRPRLFQGVEVGDQRVELLGVAQAVVFHLGARQRLGRGLR
ncbi:hypothetical protein KOJCDNHJ_02371 [Xanthomonas citri pv. punicae]|nr:hypothetical protein KOJCDNHJ_02371 [Xanthomonas citri pv. punicae]